MIRKNKDTRKCEICETKITILTELLHNGLGGKHIHRKEHLFSEEGIMFAKSWFCNECWKLVLKKPNKKKKVEATK